MSVRAIGDAFASELHLKSLRSRGFKKSKHTFTCERPDYVEMLQIQGSPWNSGQEPWQFYVNVLVRFKGLPDSSKLKDAKYHSDGRLEGIVTHAPYRYDLSLSNLAQLVMLITGLAEEASRILPELLPVARERAMRGLYSPIPVPRTWVASEPES